MHHDVEQKGEVPAMKVRDVMKGQPRMCSPEHGLGTAGRIMDEVGCGVLPVVSASGTVVGMITDRDICCTVSIRDRRPSEIRVSEAMSEGVYSCRAEDEIASALRTMRERQVRRLPVLAEDGELVGLLVLDDIIAEAKLPVDEMAQGMESRDEEGALAYEVAATIRVLAGHTLLAASYPRRLE